MATRSVHPVRMKDLTYNPSSMKNVVTRCFDYKLDLHLCGEHGDVMKLSTSSLFDRDCQEESAAVFGEHWFLSLQKANIHQHNPIQSVF